MKRQNSWQDGIARIFKSYDSDKTGRDSDTTVLEKEADFASGKDDSPDPVPAPDPDMPKALQGSCEGEEGGSRRSSRDKDRDTQQKDQEQEVLVVVEKEEEEEAASAPDNEAGSEAEPPDRQPATPRPPDSPGPSPSSRSRSPSPPPSSLPQPAAAVPTPDADPAPAPAPAPDSFLKRLGNFFHFFSKPEGKVAALQQQEEADSTVPPLPPSPSSSPLSSPPSSSSSSSLPSPWPLLSLEGLVPCEGDYYRSLQVSKTTTELPPRSGDGDLGPRLGQEEEMEKIPAASQRESCAPCCTPGSSPALAYQEAAIVAAPTDPQGQMPKSLLSVHEDHGAASSPDTDRLPSGQEADDETQEQQQQQQQQGFEGPAVVTHTTYRGQKELRRSRRRQQQQRLQICSPVCSPISEGNESQVSGRGSVPSGGEGEGSPCPPSPLSAGLAQHGKSPLTTGPSTTMGSEQSDVSLPATDDAFEEAPSQTLEAAGVQLPCAQEQTETPLNAKEENLDTVSSLHLAQKVQEDLDAVLSCKAEEEHVPPPSHQGCQEETSSTVLLLPDVGQSENNSLLCVKQSLDAQSQDQAAGMLDYNRSIVTGAVIPHLPEDNRLQCESKAMVENILRNALTALQEMETHSKKADSGRHDAQVERESFVFSTIRHGFQEDEFDFKPALQELEDKHVVPTTEDDQVISGRAQGDGSRSTFSSGYESIAGSDTDIRSSPGQSFEGSPQSLPTIAQQFECPMVVVPEMTKEEVTEHPEIKNTKFGETESESDERKRNIVFVELEDGNPNVCVVTDDKPAMVCKVDSFYFYPCLAGEPEASKDATQISAQAEKSVDNDSVSCCAIQSRSVVVEEKFVPHEVISHDKMLAPDNVTVNTPVAIADSLSSDCKSEEKVHNQEETRPKPLPIAQESLESHTVNAKAITEPTCSNECESSSEWTTTVAETCAISEDRSQTSSEREAMVSDLRDSLTALLAPTQDKNMDVMEKQSGSSIDSSVSAPAPRRLLHPEFSLIATEQEVEEEEEEEEMDAIFVNDTGPMDRASAGGRSRGKIYPFSLSPILEEEESMQVPPATEEGREEEEQEEGAAARAGEQLACSVLSLLQSVSERLQSSAFSDSDSETCGTPGSDLIHALQSTKWRSDSDTCTDSDTLDTWMPRWRSTSDSEGVEDEKDQLADQDHLALPSNAPEDDGTQITGGGGDGGGSIKSEQAGNGSRDEATEEKDWVSLLSKPRRVPSSPFYDYLKAKPTPLPAEETVKDRSVSKAITKGELPSLGKIFPRPSVMHIYNGVTFSGEKQTICADVVDTGGMMALKNGASIHVQSGCWLLYVEAGFKGSCVVLEEGGRISTQGNKPPQQPPDNSTDSLDQVSIGSIRTIAKYDSIPEIHCHGESPSPLTLCSQREHLKAAPISKFTVKSGCWLAYEETGFSGNFAVLEIGGKISYGPGSPITQARSLRPLTRGGPKVSRPLDPKVVLYELPGFRGDGVELGASVPQVAGLQRVCSLRVVTGIWVGYLHEGYRGRQCLLEEGEYADCRELCGADATFLSLRCILSDCIEPAISLRNALSSESAPVDMVDQDVPDVEKEGGAHLAPVSICVKSGVWVAYSGKWFSEEQYVLEKGHHQGPLDWGDSSGEVMSIRPVRLSGGTRDPKYLIRAYSEENFCGEHREYEAKVADCSSLSAVSFRVIHGSWVLYDEEGCSGSQYFLTEGLYPNLTSCGNEGYPIRSLKPVPYCFSDPSISLFSLDSFEGLETTALTTMEDMNGFYAQSVRVNSGQWVAYEYSHFKGRQMLLSTGPYSRWTELSGWATIGSLQPLRKPRVYIQLRNRSLGSVLTAEATQEKDVPARVSLKPAACLDTQQWIFTEGLLKSKVGKACLSVIGGKANVGARVALWPEHGRTHQRWSLNEDGTISSHLNPSLVLDIRGGNGVDRDHFIVNQSSSEQPAQYWDIELA